MAANAEGARVFMEKYVDDRGWLLHTERWGGFITSFDWEHTGEGLQAFHFYGLARPDDPRYRERVVRFAGFCNGDDPAARNYDPEHRVIRSLYNGSRGPKMTPATEEDWGGLPVPGEPDRVTRYSTAFRVAGDHPLNLLSTTLGVTAWMLTGDRKFLPTGRSRPSRPDTLPCPWC